MSKKARHIRVSELRWAKTSCTCCLDCNTIRMQQLQQISSFGKIKTTPWQNSHGTNHVGIAGNSWILFRSNPRVQSEMKKGAARSKNSRISTDSVEILAKEKIYIPQAVCTDWYKITNYLGDVISTGLIMLSLCNVYGELIRTWSAR